MNQHVLVTGGTGFIGYYIVKSLVETGYKVTVMARAENPDSPIRQLNDQINFVKGDLTDLDSLEAACNGQDIIVHAAALISFDPAERKKIFKNNIDGTTHLVNTALKSSVKKLIYISSIAAISSSPDEQDHDESIPWDLKSNHSNYALSKHAAEMEVWRGSAEGLEVGILNPSVVLGRWEDHHHSMQLFNMMRRGILFYPEGSTGWVDVRDVAKAVVAFIESGIINQQFIINGHNESYQDILQMIATAIGKKGPRYLLPRSIALTATRLYALLNKIASGKRVIQASVIKSLYKEVTYNNAKSISQLGLAYTSLRDTIEWVVNNKAE
ncbi:MAG: SDR family NAD(P)-dependent oxidoreductase [Saprospiraceae bacterium]